MPIPIISIKQTKNITTCTKHTHTKAMHLKYYFKPKNTILSTISLLSPCSPFSIFSNGCTHKRITRSAVFNYVNFFLTLRFTFSNVTLCEKGELGTNKTWEGLVLIEGHFKILQVCNMGPQGAITW